MKNIISSLLLVLLISSPVYSICEKDIVEMYSSLVEQWKQEISQCFDQAEQEVLNVNPSPENPVGPNEDPAKCICKGTGIITHGDGHTTPCPFHSKSEPPMVKIEKTTTCECETKCGCNPCKCEKMEIQ